jgi:DNA polymerase/3'-5' exonuclease PolX
MNAITEIKNMINENEYLKDLVKEQAVKIKELEQLIRKADEEQISKHLEDEIQRVGAVLNEAEKPSLFETTARTKTFTINREIAAHLTELGEMTSDFYKTATYERAAEIVATLPYQVSCGMSLIKIDGIGRGIAGKIDLFLAEYFEDNESVASTEGQILEESDDETDEESALSLDSSESDSDDDFVVSYNPDLTDVFDKLASCEQDSHKRNAYRTAADAINNLTFKVTSGVELSKGPKKVKGIGKSTAKIIDEFLTTGKVGKLEKVGSTNEEIAWALEALASLEGEDHGSQDPFKIRAYRKAAEIIRELDFEVTSGEEAKKLPGIGKGIAKKIDEFLQTGKIERLEELSSA